MRVSVLIPALDEERDIAGCLQGLAAQTVGPDSLQVVLADGGSVDRTADIARATAAVLGIGQFSVVDNPVKRTSAGLNAALRVATGEHVVRIDARSRVAPDYIEKSLAVLRTREEVGVVGGAQVAVARDQKATSCGIARALRNRYTTGLARYRMGTRSGPTDTVWMGVFRRADLVALGGWDETVALNEDFELNQRYREAGKLVWFEAALRSQYLPRPTLGSLATQYFRFGRVKGTWWARGHRPSRRQQLLLSAPVLVTLASVPMVRRRGVGLTVGCWVALLLVADEVGGDGPADVRVRAVASVGIVTYCSAWLAGVAAGFLGEHLGVQHAHG